MFLSVPSPPCFLELPVISGWFTYACRNNCLSCGQFAQVMSFYFLPISYLWGLSKQQAIGGLGSGSVSVVCSVQAAKHLRSYQTQLWIIAAYSVFFFLLLKRFCTFQTQSRALGSRPCLLSLPQLWLQIWTTVLVISLMINPDIRLSARSLYIATPLWPAPVWTWIGNLGIRPVSKGTSELEWFSRIVEITSSASALLPSFVYHK